MRVSRLRGNGGTAVVDAPPAVDADVAAPVEDKFVVATQRQLIWMRFKRHKLAMASAYVLIFFYLVAIFADFLAYADPQHTNGDLALRPPQRIHVFSGSGVSLHVHPVISHRDPVTFERIYSEDTSKNLSIKFFAPGYEYKLFGLFPTHIHLIGVSGARAENVLAIFGTDDQGRDIYSRLLLATRTSLTIGLVGVAMSLFLGVVVGAISGYYGGRVDLVIQRVIEIMRSIPAIPLWLGLAAAMPRDWPIIRVYFFITLIISLIGWTELARVVRGRFLQIRDEDFVTAAEMIGARPRRVIFVHILPMFTSHVIAATTLALPLMIVAETSLSFLGLGLRSPAVSWGVMLQDAQNVQAIALSPWLLIPVIPVVLAILAFNFFGDGLRDAADPYDA
ncbi:MAG TPA: ABC transporter permease [Jatrophihabitans sp.]|jgi:peptide/nickel transport system permease protein|nr:ABC transporter permease [Jatrophihabitans sp.]